MPTSFIPKRVLEQPGRSQVRPVGLLVVISFVVLFISLVIWGGAFAYKKLLINKVAELKNSVALEKKNLDQNTIEVYQRTDKKLQIAQTLLDKHMILVPIFRMLEEVTLPSVRYTKFDYSPKALNLEGQALSYADIALQTQELAKDKDRVQSFIFSDLNLANDSSEVTFKLTIVPELDITSYYKNLAI